MQQQIWQKIQMYFDQFFPSSRQYEDHEIVWAYTDMTIKILNEIDKKNEYKRTSTTTIQINDDTVSFVDEQGYVNFEKLLNLIENAILLKKLEILEEN